MGDGGEEDTDKEEIHEKTAEEFLEFVEKRINDLEFISIITFKQEIKAVYNQLNLHEQDRVWQIATDEQKGKISFLKPNNK